MEYYGVYARTACTQSRLTSFICAANCYKCYIGIGVGLNNGAFKLRINVFNISSAINANNCKTLFF